MKKSLCTLLSTILVLSALHGRSAAEGERRELTGSQREALDRLDESLTYLDFRETAVPSWILGDLGPAKGEPQTAAVEAMRRLGEVFRTTDADGFEARRPQTDEVGQTHVRLDQRYRGLRVVGGELIVHMEGGFVTGVNGRFVPDLQLEIRPRLAADVALGVAERELTRGRTTPLGEAELVVFATAGDLGRLAWTRPVGFTGEEGDHQQVALFADAATGALLAQHSLIQTAKNRKIHDGTGVCLQTNTLGLPGPLMRQEGNPPAGDAAADAAYDGTGKTWDYYKYLLGRDSYDGAGGALVSSAHVTFGSSCSPNNAAWLKLKEQMTYGDGNGSLFTYLSKDVDVTAHELTHGVTQHEANLVYSKEPGAMNEGMSDILGETVDVYQACPAWKIGEGVYTPNIPGDALRYMNDPSLDGASPDYYPDVQAQIESCSPSQGNDWCGVHTNSGIANLAFHLVSAGGTHPQGKTATVVPAIGIDTAARIFYRALASFMVSTDGFPETRKATALAAQSLFPCGTLKTGLVDAVHKAWEAVGVPEPVNALWALPPGPGGGGPLNPCVFQPGTYNMLFNSGFESGPVVWQGNGYINKDNLKPAYQGLWKAWLGGAGWDYPTSLRQQAQIPDTALQATLSFRLRVDTFESGSTAQDTLSVELWGCGRQKLATLATYSNLDAGPSYAYHSFDVLVYKGQPVRVYFRTKEDLGAQTSFVLDEVQLRVK